MPSFQHADRPTDVGTVAALISEAQRLRGKVDAVRRETTADVDGDLGRWQRALCDLAVRQLNDLGEHLGQLREQIVPLGETPDTTVGAVADDPVPAEPVPGRPQRSGSARLGRAGSAEWNLVTDEVSWSEEMFRIFGRDPADGPLTLDELPTWLFCEDRHPVAAMVTACLVDGRPMDAEFRIVRPDGVVRTVHLVGEPVLDNDGSTLSMWAVLRDISDLRRSQRVVRETRESLRHSRQAARTARRMAVELQEAVRPAWRGPLRFPQDGAQALDLAARYLPSGTGAPVGGDWYDALELPDGRTLLTVGDLTGHGVHATSGMALLLGALRGMAVAGVEPGAMMRSLNQLLDRSGHPVLGSALCCVFEPRERTLSWAQAGHPAPLLYRDGGARALEPPEGVLLGATADADYTQRTDRLAAGDVVILHTGGLVPRRGSDTAAGVRQLLALSARIAGTRSARDCVRVIVEEFGAPDREDDACVMAARIC